MEQLELFKQKVQKPKNNMEYIQEKDYVYVKRDLLSNKVIPINSYIQGYVTKIENIDNKRLCHVFSAIIWNSFMTIN